MTRSPALEAKVGRADSASWYLDPVVARQKAEAFLALIDRWRDPDTIGVTLKTDLFEEANGEDALVPRLDPGLALIGLDLDLETVCRARRRFADFPLEVLVADLRSLGVRDSAFDLVVSPSTLDHFRTRDELEVSLREIGRVLRPGGIVILILDNPLNPLYHPLRWLAPRVAPYSLGRTLGRRRLSLTLERLGFDVLGHDYAIHNPRGVLTLLNLLLRSLLGGSAERPIRALVRLFATLDRLPTRAFSACFVAVAARKRWDGARSGGGEYHPLHSHPYGAEDGASR
jgi:SAM-dependent methyltransferase